MDKLLEQFVKRMNKPFIDLLYVMFGMIFLFALNWIYTFDISKIPNSNNINGVTLTVLFIAISYYIGRMFMLISSVWKGLFFVMIGKDKYKKVKKSIKEIKNYADGISISIESSSSNIYEAEISSIIDENESIKGRLDREILNNVFLNLNIGLVIVLMALKLHYVGIIILVLLTLFEIRTHININMVKVDLMKNYYKKSNNQYGGDN